MYSGLTKVLSFGKKKDEIMETICDVHLNPMDVIDKCGEVAMSVQRQGIETLTDTTCAIGKGLCKTFRKQTSNATIFVREVKECVDPEDMIKSLYQLGKQDCQRNNNVIHTPIDWSKRSPLLPRSKGESTDAKGGIAEQNLLPFADTRNKESLYASHNNVSLLNKHRRMSHEDSIDHGQDADDTPCDDVNFSTDNARCFHDTSKKTRSHSKMGCPRRKRRGSS